MTLFLLACFAAPMLGAFYLCRKELFGRPKMFDPEDRANAILCVALGITVLASPFAVGWLSCILYRTGAEAWPFVFVSWTGVLLGAIAARAADCGRVWKAADGYREANEGLVNKARELGIINCRHDYEPHDLFGGYRPEIHALWWLRGHDKALPKVERAEVDGATMLLVNGKGTLVLEDGCLLLDKGCLTDPLPLLASLLWIYDETARAEQAEVEAKAAARTRARGEEPDDEE